MAQITGAANIGIVAACGLALQAHVIIEQGRSVNFEEVAATPAARPWRAHAPAVSQTVTPCVACDGRNGLTRVRTWQRHARAPVSTYTAASHACGVFLQRTEVSHARPSQQTLVTGFAVDNLRSINK